MSSNTEGHGASWRDNKIPVDTSNIEQAKTELIFNLLSFMEWPTKVSNAGLNGVIFDQRMLGGLVDTLGQNPIFREVSLAGSDEISGLEHCDFVYFPLNFDSARKLDLISQIPTSSLVFECIKDKGQLTNLRPSMSFVHDRTTLRFGIREEITNVGYIVNDERFEKRYNTRGRMNTSFWFKIDTGKEKYVIDSTYTGSTNVQRYEVIQSGRDHELFKTPNPMFYAMVDSIFDRNKRTGFLYRFHINGNVKNITPYRNGKRNGNKLMYNSDGELTEITHYLNGNDQGFSGFFYPSGAAVSRLHMNETGWKEGVQEYYYPNQIIKKIASYLDGYEDGFSVEFDSMGMYQLTSYYEQDKRIYSVVDSVSARGMIEYARGQNQSVINLKKSATDMAEIKLLNKEEKKRQNQLLIGVIIGLCLVLVIVFVLAKSSRQRKLDNERILYQKAVVEHKNKEITDSINYARRIQSAILPPTKLVKEYLQESFILYKPKDIVAGDFYWMETVGDDIYFSAADCTGHGVPGAMVSVMCSNALSKAVKELKKETPADILDATVQLIEARFEMSEESMKDGMDLALCKLNLVTLKLQFSGANNPLWIVRAGEVIEYKADKQPVGAYDYRKPYTNNDIQLEKGDVIYLSSDGFVDQFGGEKGKKFKSKPFKRLLLSIQDKSMDEQRGLIDEAFENWRGELEQVDDVCVIGVRV